MKKSEELSNPNSCWNKAKDDEIVFVLLERDMAITHTIREWVHGRVTMNLNSYDDPKIKNALAIADEIEKKNSKEEQE